MALGLLDREPDSGLSRGTNAEKRLAEPAHTRRLIPLVKATRASSRDLM